MEQDSRHSQSRPHAAQVINAHASLIIILAYHYSSLHFASDPHPHQHLTHQVRCRFPDLAPGNSLLSAAPRRRKRRPARYRPLSSILVQNLGTRGPNNVRFRVSGWRHLTARRGYGRPAYTRGLLRCKSTKVFDVGSYVPAGFLLTIKLPLSTATPCSNLLMSMMMERIDLAC